MPGEIIEVQSRAVEGDNAMQNMAPELVDGHEFLNGLGIGAFATAQVVDHEGKVTTLADAMSRCLPARVALETQVETFKELGVDIEKGMQVHTKKMSKKALETAEKAAIAKKK